NELHSVVGTKHPGRQLLRLNVIRDDSMPPSYTRGHEKWDAFVRISNGQMNGVFESIGYTTHTDTDEMIGEPALLNIGIRTIQSGARMGEKVNEVRGVVPADDVEDLIEEIFEDDEDDEDTF